MLLDYLLLFIAGLIGGMFNSIAGGGTFITFPALLFVGVPPISANATNTFAACSGYISGAYAFRKELLEYKSKLPKLILMSLIGGIIGAWLLLKTPQSLFREAIPWLLLFATILFIYGGQLNTLVKNMASEYQYASSVGGILLSIIFLGVCVYGGFFNAGLGIILLSYFVLAGYKDINTMNGLKLVISSFVSLIAIALFIYKDVIVWREGSLVLIGTLIGGYIAAHVSRKIPQQYINNAVIVISLFVTGYFFYDVYFNNYKL